MDQLLSVLQRRLRQSALSLPGELKLELLAYPGRTEAVRVRIGDIGCLLHIPEQSPCGLSAEENLRYQAECFLRAAASAHTPRLHAVLEPDDELPTGALMVDEVIGAVLQLPAGLYPLAEALAAIHALPLPQPDQCVPLKNPTNMVEDAVNEVLALASYLKQAALHPDALREIRREIASAREMLLMPYHPPAALVSSDARAGNFIVDQQGKAYLVHLQNARYGLPGLDLAYATLYTSTTWDMATHAVLDIEQITDFYRCWLESVPTRLAESSRPWLLPLRRIMWLWSVSWCARWRVHFRETGQSDKRQSVFRTVCPMETSDPELLRHMEERVDNYLHPHTVNRIRDEWLNHNALTALLQG